MDEFTRSSFTYCIKYVTYYNMVASVHLVFVLLQV